MTDLWGPQREALGAFIREQRKRANLSLRQLAELTSLSNPYLSQVERGLHQPSVRVLKAISDALNLSAETMLAQAGLIDAMAATAPDGTADETAEPKDLAGHRGRHPRRPAPQRRAEGGADRRLPQHARLAPPEPGRTEPGRTKPGLTKPGLTKPRPNPSQRPLR